MIESFKQFNERERDIDDIIDDVMDIAKQSGDWEYANDLYKYTRDATKLEELLHDAANQVSSVPANIVQVILSYMYNIR